MMAEPTGTIRSSGRIRFREYLGLVYVMVLLLLLTVLAVLQYRWTGEASLAEQQRMQRGVRVASTFMGMTFDREVTRILLAFWPDPMTLAHSWKPFSWRDQVGRNLAERFRELRATARHPRLLNQILVAENPDSGPTRLFHFEPPSLDWKEVEWPAELSELRNVIDRHAEGAFTDEDNRRWSPYQNRFLFPYRTLASIPAFVGPLAIEPRGPGRAREEAGGTVRLCLVLWLDRAYISEQWLPDLAVSYLSAGNQVDYEYVVVEQQEPARIICKSSTANQQGLLLAPDAEISLLKICMEEPLAPGPQILEEEEGAFPEQRRAWPLSVRVEPPSGAGLGSEDARGKQWPVQRRPGTEEHWQGLSFAIESMNFAGWRLLVRHRAGSVSAAVAQSRARNLYVSFGILAVLAGSLVVFALAVRRARQLAEQQMNFLASISHELRTPVTAVCSLSQNLAEGLVQPPEKMKRYGELLLREGRRLGSLVEQALNFAGAKSGRRRYRLRAIALEPIIRQALQSHEVELREYNAQVEVTIEPDLPLVVADAEAVGCALQNLLSNAIKYSARESMIIAIQAKTSGRRWVEVVVQDQGMGIAPDEQKRLFEPFFRGRNALRARIRGTGIGLSLVKHIMDVHHGRVRISSRPSKGTAVTLSLRAVEPLNEEDQDTDPVDPVSNGWRDRNGDDSSR
ncbi:MAG: sensor histidine kinase [Acidobacteriota bacterium]